MWTWSFDDLVDSEEESPQYTYESSPLGGPDEYPPYWVRENYWVAEGCPVNQTIKESAESILEPLNADHIAQAGIVCMPNEGFTNPGVWADRFATYHGFGEADGDPREDNGMLWLILYGENSIEVHYAIGDGLPAITAISLGSIVRDAEQATSVSQAVEIISIEFDQVAREKYQPLNPVEPSFGGQIEKSSEIEISWVKLILTGYILLQPFAFLMAAAGLVSLFDSIFWPLKLGLLFLESSSSGSFSASGGSFSSRDSSSSGGSHKSLGGGGGIHRSN